MLTEKEILANLLKNNYLETSRLILRPLTLEDLKDYHEYSSDSETLTYDYPPHKDIDESREMLTKWHLANPAGKYGIFLKSEEKIIGNINLNFSESECSIGFTINKNYWRKGYGTEALTRLAASAFNDAGISKITAKVDARNLPSKSLLKKVGFKLINSVKDTLDYRNMRFDEETYLLVKSDC